MIMSADGPSPEDEVPSRTIDELNRQMAEATGAYNAAPDPEMGGLSPEQVFRLIHCRLGESTSPIQLNTELPAEQFESSPFFCQTSLLLRAIHDRGGVKATTSKNLTRRFVNEIMDDLVSAETCAEIRKYKKTINEKDVDALHIARVVAQGAGLIRFIKGKFVVPKTKAPLLVPERPGDLFREIFVAFFRKFNLAYLYPLGPDASALQSCVAYTLCRLDVVAVDWVAVGDLAESVLLPAVREEIEADLDGHPFLTVHHLLRFRILRPLIKWGLLEGRYECPEDKYRKELVSVRNTPLQGAVLRFELDQ